ncbi:HD domain-containing protein [candidate division WOR-3 bacterium]|uniref:HD domain-containing protein n=1 Tax=candidate division WOR-3 bacterium TaxID=2052148 RepID=A0A9D5QDI0_UNCW3|nr:HD domain-containing protein [candidate division WOR-3 bacterium]MBD3365081.1 HD domain-containing protein [candidate division WOR-3 bacterium]
MDSNKPYNLDEEIAAIEDSSIKEFVSKALGKVPDYFWHVPASASGRFHPLDTLDDGGLVLHTKRVVYLATEIAKVFKIEGVRLDVLRAASILHDSFKNGIADEGHTEEDHPLIVRYQLKDFSADTTHFDEIMEAIECHQGLWGPQPLRMPKKPVEWALHIADFVASRSAFYLYFSGYKSPKTPDQQDMPYLAEDLAESISYYLDLRVKRAEIEKQMEEIKLKIIEEMNQRGERKVFSTKGSARLINNTHLKINQPKLREVLERMGLWEKVAMANEKRLQELLADGLVTEEELNDSVEKVSKDGIRILPRED